MELDLSELDDNTISEAIFAGADIADIVRDLPDATRESFVADLAKNLPRYRDRPVAELVIRTVIGCTSIPGHETVLLGDIMSKRHGGNM
jgi:hypothetical protein